MSSRLYLAKYVEDVRRGEPVNVGLIAADESSVAARFLGEDQGQLDLRRVQSVVRSIEAREAYREWWKYWRRMVAQGVSGLSEILASSTNNYFVVDAGGVLIGNDTPEMLVNEFFGQLVRRDETSGDEPDEELPAVTVENLLDQTGISKRPELRRDQALRDVGYPFHKEWKFHYIYVNGGPPVVAERINPNPFIVAGILWRFSRLPEDVVRVSFVSSRHPVPEEEDVRSLTTAIDVANPQEAQSRIRAVFLGG